MVVIVGGNDNKLYVMGCS